MLTPATVAATFVFPAFHCVPIAYPANVPYASVPTTFIIFITSSKMSLWAKLS
jgi:hypothetical protein